MTSWRLEKEMRDRKKPPARWIICKDTAVKKLVACFLLCDETGEKQVGYLMVVM